MGVPTAKESSGPAIVTQSLPGCRKTLDTGRKLVSLGVSCLGCLCLHFQQCHLHPGLSMGLHPRGPTFYKVQGWGSCRLLCLFSTPEMLLRKQNVPDNAPLLSCKEESCLEEKRWDYCSSDGGTLCLSATSELESPKRYTGAAVWALPALTIGFRKKWHQSSRDHGNQVSLISSKSLSRDINSHMGWAGSPLG